jgi:hydrogenase expression/formation protein HypE
MTDAPKTFASRCPIPLSEYPAVVMAHGGGGSLMRRLIADMIAPTFASPHLAPLTDGAVLPALRGRPAMTTDSYVVRPTVFPGGDIGSLAVNGTVNDLAMCGARPLYLSVAFVLREGLPMADLWQVVRSMKAAADAAGVALVTGDTKVVERGDASGITITTTGIGEVVTDPPPAPGRIRPGDTVLVSGDLGRHGMAVMAAREGLDLDPPIESDCAPLWPSVAALLDAGIAVRALRDLTRGGLAAGLVELAQGAGLGIEIAETAVPVGEAVRGACAILGLDPMHVANEGRFVAVVPGEQADRARAVLGAVPVSAGARALGTVRAADSGRVTLTTGIGGRRVIDLPSGEQLPRIC